MEIRLATIEDLNSVMEITTQIVNEMKKGDVNMCQWTEAYPTQDVYKKDINAMDLYVCVDENKILGFICLNDEQAPEYSNLTWPDGKYLVIHRTGVSTSARGKGVAIKLLEHAYDFAKTNNYKVIRTDTFSKNTRMNKLFNKMGYTNVGQVYFSDEAITEPDTPFNCYCKTIKE